MFFFNFSLKRQQSNPTVLYEEILYLLAIAENESPDSSLAKEMDLTYEGKPIIDNFDLAVKYIHGSAADDGGASP